MFSAEVVHRRELPGVPSASAVEVHRDILFVVGDDSRFLFCLDQNGREIAAVPLFKGSTTPAERIEKKNKEDLEASALVATKHGVDVFIFGSGSRSPERDVCYRVHIPEECFDNPETVHWKREVKVHDVPIEKLYQDIRTHRDLWKGGVAGELNIEAATVVDDRMVLFQRGIKGRNNVMISYPLEDFLGWAKGDNAHLPKPSLNHFGLPSLDGIGAGFSGATFDPTQKNILFCASAEDTSSAIDDGAIRGSIIGRIVARRGEFNKSDSKAAEWAPVTQDGKVIEVKIESVAVVGSAFAGGDLMVRAVTDSDGGPSELLDIRLSELK